MAPLTACTARVVAPCGMGLTESAGPARTPPTPPPRTVSATREPGAKRQGQGQLPLQRSRSHPGHAGKEIPASATTPNLRRERNTLGSKPASSGVWSRNPDAANTGNKAA